MMLIHWPWWLALFIVLSVDLFVQRAPKAKRNGSVETAQPRIADSPVNCCIEFPATSQHDEPREFSKAA